MLRVQLLQSNEFQSIGDIFEASPKLERGDALMSSTEFQLKFFLSWQPRLKQSKTPSLIYPGLKKRQEEFKSASAGTPQTKVGYFVFLGDTISLIPLGFLFTMNPGYASQTELPENLKAFFALAPLFVPILPTGQSDAGKPSVQIVQGGRQHFSLLVAESKAISLLNEIVTKHLINFNVTFVVDIMRKRTISFVIHKPIVCERTSYSLAVHA